MSGEIESVKRRLQRGYRRVLRQCEQAIRDCRSWNRINPTERPLDCEWFIVYAAGLRKCLAAIERNEPISEDWLPKN
jgi:hypothetical protein